MITWLNKIDGFDLNDPQKNVNAADMNEIKTTVNTNETTLTNLGASFTTFTGTTFQGSFVENEVPVGTMNSSNPTFTLANTPIVGSVKLYINGIRLQSGGIGYSISGATITMTIPPDSGDILLADYRK